MRKVFTLLSLLVGVAQADPNPQAVIDKMQRAYEALAKMNHDLADHVDELTSYCTEHPDDQNCVNFHNTCTHGGGRAGGAVKQLCDALHFQEVTGDPLLPVEGIRSIAAACSDERAAPDTREPVNCQKIEALCALPKQYAFYLDDSIEAMCGDPAYPSNAHVRELVTEIHRPFPHASHDDDDDGPPQPGPYDAFAYFKLMSATSKLHLADGWGLGIDYRANPGRWPFGAELDVSVIGKVHALIGFHAGIGFVVRHLGVGLLAGFEKGGMLHDGQILPGDVVLFGRFGKLKLQFDGQVGFRFGDGTEPLYLRAKLAVPIAGGESGLAPYVGVDAFEEDGTAYASVVLGFGGFQ